ncbi:MAG: ankyrin repeat domain-containing protein [Vulcanimicrobiota bacterium]
MICRYLSEAPSALHLASELGYPDIVKLLVEKGASVNIRDVYAMSPLHWASSGGYERIADLLISRGADVSCSSNTEQRNDARYNKKWARSDSNQ